MALTAEQRDRLVQFAQQQGVDPDELVAAGERVLGQAPREQGVQGEQPNSSGRPMNERLLIGHLPYLRVNELRTLFLGLDPAPDGELFTGEWLEKHGGAVTKPPSDGGE